MAELVASIEADLHTQYGLLKVEQPGAEPEEPNSSYASSWPGLIDLRCGSTYAAIQIRLERWDGIPPTPADDWEDFDELPWRAIEGPAQVQAWAFDTPSESLDLTGLERGRVQVLAEGRYRETNSDSPDGLPPERWLLRFWPEDEPSDAMAGPPRRLIVPLSAPPRDAWKQALRMWGRLGWGRFFGSQIFALEHIRMALWHTDGPFSEQTLAEILRQHHAGLAASDDLWCEPAFRDPESWTDPPKYAHEQHARDGVAEIRQRIKTAGRMTAIATYRDALEWFVRTGLLGRLDPQAGGLYVVNGRPRPRWELDGHDEGVDPRLLALQGETGFLPIADDIRHLLRWTPDGILRTSPARIAARLGLPLADVLDTLELLALREELRLSPEIDAVRESPVTDTIEIQATGRAG